MPLLIRPWTFHQTLQDAYSVFVIDLPLCVAKNSRKFKVTQQLDRLRISNGILLKIADRKYHHVGEQQDNKRPTAALWKRLRIVTGMEWRGDEL